MGSYRIRLGARIEARRKAHGLNRKEFAGAVGISQRILREIEEGAIATNLGIIERIAVQLAITPERLLGDDSPQSPKIGLIKPSLAATIAGLNDVEAALLEEAVNGILRGTRGTAHPQKHDQPKHKR